MDIKIACPQCQWSFSVAEDFVGKRVRCLKCHTIFTAEAPRKVAIRRGRADAGDDSSEVLAVVDASHEQEGLDRGPRRIPKRRGEPGGKSSAFLLDPFVLVLGIAAAFWGLLALLYLLLAWGFLYVLLLALGGVLSIGGVVWFGVLLAVHDPQMAGKPLFLIGVGLLLSVLVFPLDSLTSRLHSPGQSDPARQADAGGQLGQRVAPWVPPPRPLPPHAGAIRNEPPPWARLQPPDEPPPPIEPLFERGPLVYLADLKEFGVRSGKWPFTKDGSSGNGADRIRVGGQPSPKGLGMHPPPAPAYASVRYRLGKQAAVFKTTVAVNDTANFCWTPAVFALWGDGKQLFVSSWIAHNHLRSQECSVSVAGVDVLELRVGCVGHNDGVHAVWVEPRLLQKQDTTDRAWPRFKTLFEDGPREYLTDLQEMGVKPGPWPLGKYGDVGGNHGTIRVSGKLSPMGLGLHPPDRGFSAVQYRLDKKAALFKGAAALDDACGIILDRAVFQVVGDGKLLWMSAAMSQAGVSQEFQVEVQGVDVLELRVVAPGSHFGLHAVWVEPRLLKEKDTPDR